MDKKTSQKDSPLFSIGDSVQTPKDFEKQVISRFGALANFERAWEEAIEFIEFLMLNN